MPKRKGYVQVVVQVPEGLKAAADAKRADAPLAAYVCGLIAADTGTHYEAPKPGPKPGTKYKPRQKKPAPKKK